MHSSTRSDQVIWCTVPQIWCGMNRFGEQFRCVNSSSTQNDKVTWSISVQFDKEKWANFEHNFCSVQGKIYCGCCLLDTKFSKDLIPSCIADYGHQSQPFWTQQTPPHFIIRVDSKMESQQLPWVIGTIMFSLEWKIFQPFEHLKWRTPIRDLLLLHWTGSVSEMCYIPKNINNSDMDPDPCQKYAVSQIQQHCPKSRTLHSNISRCICHYAISISSLSCESSFSYGL